MTALEITTDGNGAFEHLDAAPPVCWEPCAAFADAGPAAGPLTDVPACATCGWLADDHLNEGGDEADREGSVVTLPTRPVLRRAS
ncbi:MAG TPA: hypothetical protein VFW06_09950 [Acidimicrobiia bacterium]|nr:hypothetical protein [Acidimicrobiia bacterium]